MTSDAGCVLRKLALGCLAAASLLLTPYTLKAQFTSAIEGQVTDASGAAVPNAEVTVEQLATGIKRVVHASDVGYFRVASLPPGQVTIHVSAKGFDTAVYEDVRLESDQTKTFTVQLKVGASATEVTVTAAGFDVAAPDTAADAAI